MIDCRRDLELPSVLDSDPDLVRKLGSLIERLICFDLPGVGINHTLQGDEDPATIHDVHRQLISRALEPMLMDERIVSGKNHILRPEFTKFDFKPTDQSTNNIHTDKFGWRPAYPDWGEMVMQMRLHTAGVRNGTDVLLANTAQGFDCAKDKGRLAQLLEGGYDHTLSEPDFYHFSQEPSCSVVFRTFSDIGPVSIHDFVAKDHTIRREAYLTNFELVSH